MSIPNYPSFGLIDSEPEGIERHVQPDVLLPCQFGQPPVGKYANERRLMLAILTDAIYCWRGRSGRGGDRRQAEADYWIFDDYAGDMSFAAVCESVGVEPEYLRNGLRAWKAVGGKLNFHRHGMMGMNYATTRIQARYERVRHKRKSGPRGHANLKGRITPTSEAFDAVAARLRPIGGLSGGRP